MISKTEISGWWDQVCMRPGWSDRVSKRKWMVLQIIVPVLVFFSVVLIFRYLTNGNLTMEGTRVGVLVVAGIALANHRRWNRDQQKIQDKENEQMVML